ISVIDTQTHLSLATINGDFWYGALAISPDGSALYVAGHGGGAVIDTHTNTVVRSNFVGGGPLAVAPDGRVWAANLAAGAPQTSSVYGPTTNANTSLNIYAGAVAVSPTRSEAWLLEWFPYQQQLPEIAIFDTNTLALKGTLKFGNFEQNGFAFRPDGK